MAKLHITYGAMNRGTSETLIKTADNSTEQGLAIVVMKPAIDREEAL